MINTNVKRNSYSNRLFAIIFILYIIVLSVAMMHHELWGDELHSWNIAKASTDFSDLIRNTRYEGHPPIWYTILWIVSKFTHDLTYIQVPQFIIACLVVFVVLFFAPFPPVMKILIPFGYYFLFEYGVLTRNYAIGVLAACCICFIIRKEFRYKAVLYYVLLFIMSNTHLLAMLLAVSLHLYFLLWNFEQRKNKKLITLHLLLGIVVFFPAFYFIIPPSDSSLNVHVWLNKWDMVQQLRIIFQIPFRSFIPIPAWWNYNFWNTEFLIEAQSGYGILKIFTPFIFLSVLTLIFFILKKNKKALTVFTANFLLNILFAVIFPLTTARYVGFIYIGCIASWWLYCYDVPLTKTNKFLVNILLSLQFIAGVFTVSKDLQLPFSNSYRVNELLKEVPANKKIVTDYWCINTVSAFIDKPFYCLEMHKEMSFLLWDNEFKTKYQVPNVYTNGAKYLFKKEGLQETYMISIQSPKKISEFDTLLFKSYPVELIDKKEGAIEKSSNFYLYRIKSH